MSKIKSIKLLLVGVTWFDVDVLRYKITSHLSNRKVVWSKDAVVVRVVTHSR